MSAAQAPPPYNYQAVSTSDEHEIHGEVDPDDFKIGVTVEQSAPEIRAMFVRKVYTVLFCQILGSCIVAGGMNAFHAIEWIQSNVWFMILTIVGSFVSMGFLFWKRHEHPTNLFLLGLFTAVESIMLGIVMSALNESVILKAFILTTFIFLGLTLFTLQSSYDFSSLTTWLYWGLLLLVGTGFVQMFFPYNHAFEMGYSLAGCAVFSGYVMYDTWLLQRRLSPDDWVLANVSLYLDVVNVFISVSRLLNGSTQE